MNSSADSPVSHSRYLVLSVLSLEDFGRDPGGISWKVSRSSLSLAGTDGTDRVEELLKFQEKDWDLSEVEPPEDFPEHMALPPVEQGAPPRLGGP